jgi:superfamily II DNA helicase RecQ
MIYIWGLVKSGPGNHLASMYGGHKDQGFFWPSYGNLGGQLLTRNNQPILLLSATCCPVALEAIKKSLRLRTPTLISSAASWHNQKYELCEFQWRARWSHVMTSSRSSHLRRTFLTWRLSHHSSTVALETKHWQLWKLSAWLGNLQAIFQTQEACVLANITLALESKTK